MSQIWTWGEGVHRYLADHSPLFHCPASRERIKGVLGIFGSFRRSILEGAVLNLCDVDRAAIEAFMRFRLSQGRSPWTINGELGKVRAFLRWCEVGGVIARDPTRGVRMLKAPRRLLHRIMTLEDMRRLLRHLDKRRITYLADLVRLIANTGLRLNEALTLRIEDVDLRRGRIWIRVREGFRPKDREERFIPINELARAILKRRVKKLPRFGLAFPTRTGKPISRRNSLRSMQREAGRAGIAHATFYGLRHLFGTRSASSMPAPALAAIMGHADISTTMAHYVHRDLMTLPKPPPIR